MTTSLKEVWHQVKWLLFQKVSIIPIRDRQVGNLPAKTPFKTWKIYQSEIITEDFLWHEMEREGTSAVAIVCGAISGNLEAIDLDEKYLPGISAQIMADIKLMHPDLFKKLRIHGTPSGGFHIIYRCPVIGASTKISGRQSTAEELTLAKEKVKYYIETKGEGGYIAAPPSLNYTIIQDVPIPTITEEERISMLAICKNYNQIIKEPKPATKNKADLNYYDENPFEHYSRTADPTPLLEELGWKYINGNSRYLYFTRPGKDRGVSASFNLETRIFYPFTSNSELDQNRGYYLAKVLQDLKFRGDGRKAYVWLTENGFGRVNPSAELRQVRMKVAASAPLPANFSEEARKGYVEYQAEMTARHPHGVFWEIDDDDIKISREKLYHVAGELGFRQYEKEIVRIVAPFVHVISSFDFYNTLKAYIHEEDADLYEDICNTYEGFIQRSGDFTITRLQPLDESRLIVDTREECYKFFRSSWIEITADQVLERSYSEMTKLVFSDRVQNRDYLTCDGGAYQEFLKLAIGESLDPVKKIVGYLLHEYKDETTAYIIVLTERCADPKNGGGSGKNVFCDLLKYATSYISKPGSQTKFDEKFFQTWNRQRVFAISDVPEGFDFSFLKEPSSGSFIWKKLFKDETIVGVDRAPKFIVQTNYSYKITDGGLKRRIVPIEFTDFFTQAGGLDVYFGKHFSNDWTDDDWGGYNNFIVQSIQAWLNAGRKLSRMELSLSGWEKQFEQTYGQTILAIIKEYWDAWVKKGFIPNEAFKSMIDGYYRENNVSPHYQPSMMKIHKGVEEYAKKMGVLFEKDAQKWTGLTNERGRLFGVKEGEEELPF